MDCFENLAQPCHDIGIETELDIADNVASTELLVSNDAVTSAEDEDDSEPRNSFVLTLPLDESPSQRNRLDKIFQAANNCINALISTRKGALDQLEHDKRWRAIREELAVLKSQISALRKIKEDKRTEEQKQELAKLEKQKSALTQQETDLKIKYGFTRTEFEKFMKKHRAFYSNLIDANTGQKLASVVWRKFKEYLDGNGKQIKFSPWRDFFSIEGKDNDQGIVYKNGYLQLRTDRNRRSKRSRHAEWKQRKLAQGTIQTAEEEAITKEAVENGIVPPVRKKRNRKKKRVPCPFNQKDGMIIPVRIAKPKPCWDPETGKCGMKESPASLYEAECLTQRVKYCRIIRKHYRNGWKYFTQLILDGTAPEKKLPETGEPLHPLGKGRVGIDPSTRTIAVVSESRCLLTEIAEGVRHTHHRVQAIQRAMDRSRRATNPWFFDEKGSIIHMDKLPEDVLKEHTRNGKRVWINSKNYLRLWQRLRSEFRKLHDMHLMKHQQLANIIVSLGDDFYYEKMNWAALAKKAKKDAAKKAAKTQKAKTSRKGRKKKGTAPEAPAQEAKKNASRRRYGRSVEGKAPATLEKCLKRAVEKHGGRFQYIKTSKCKASQYHHDTKEFIKPSLDERTKTICGYVVQRDLYSGFLIRDVDSSLEGYDQEALERDFSQFLKTHNAEISRLINLQKQGVRFPSGISLEPFYDMIAV